MNSDVNDKTDDHFLFQFILPPKSIYLNLIIFLLA